MDFNNYSCSSEFACQKHPSSSSVGICAYCLKERLVKLVCSDCGEQRLSSCSCSSDTSSSQRNSSATADVGCVGRMSSLIENDKTTDLQKQFNQKPNRKGDKNRKAEEIIVLRRSNSSCVEVKRYNGFWKIRRLFWKKKDKGCDKDGIFDDRSSDFYVPDVIMGVSRSRSLCNFRGGGHNDTDDSSDYRFSSAKNSDFTGGIFFGYDKQCGQSGGESRRSERGPMEESEDRKSGFRGLFNEAEPRKSGCRRSSDADYGIDMKGNMNRIAGPFELDRAYSVPHRSGIFPIKESDFSAMDDSAFIDLKLDLSSESKPELPALKINEGSDQGANDTFISAGGSCRISVNYDRGELIKRGD